jgi:hypothetical protein
MPDKRTHRGPHPDDRELFAAEQWPVLHRAVDEYSWLLSRGYAGGSALKLVGDRYQLAQRQRLAVMRSSCSDAARDQRQAREVPADALRGATIHIDGFNVLTTIEAALSGGLILHGRDGCFRDLASMHGSYRKVEETRPALELTGAALHAWQPARCRWFLDRPVSNSGRLATLIREVAAEHTWPWEAELVNDADPAVISDSAIVASSDSVVLDRCGRWINLARWVIEKSVAAGWVVDLSGES